MSQSFFIKPKRKKSPYVIATVIIVIAVVWGVFFRPVVKTPSTPESPKVYQPIAYDVSEWQRHEQMYTVDFEMLKGLVGKTATQTEALDFYGNTADRYNFVSAHEPSLYVIESPQVFELSWYFAHAKDDDATKQTSQKHAKKAYQVATALYGDDGRLILQNMLDETELMFDDDSLLLARCQNYLCQLVIKKPTTTM